MHIRPYLPLACILGLLWIPGSLVAVENASSTATYLQEVALHRERQLGLVDGNVLAVVFDNDRGVLVETAVDWYRWSHDRFVTTVAPTREMPQRPEFGTVNQYARGTDRDAVAGERGLFERVGNGDWQRLQVDDGLGRRWAESDVRAVTYDAGGGLWVAMLAGVAHRDGEGSWKFFEGRDGLPYNDFTSAASGSDGAIWFGTRRGVVRYQHGIWSYRQGPRWLPNDEVRGVCVDGDGTAWFATPSGVGCISRRSMTLEDKAEFYQHQIDAYLRRTEFGYVVEGHLDAPGDLSRVTLNDNDNDGLWTSMYGASQCLAYAVTKSPAHATRAQQAFEALRFLQGVTQGTEHSPPVGYVARSVLPITAPDPNRGLEHDRQFRESRDHMWKVYAPRWPVSRDGKWYWKSDTSSDELDGHFFFYALYFDLVAQSEPQRQAVRAVVRGLTDHLIEHDFTLQDHDGTPTRWGVFQPRSLNRDFRWRDERGLNSLSMLSYLAVAHHITEDHRYLEVSQKLREEHFYDMNAMVPKMQRGIGSGNQSDDEMAVMSLYNLVRYTQDAELRKYYLMAFYGYWMSEQPERNPFFNFAYAGVADIAVVEGTFGPTSLAPWGTWLDDSMATLRGFPLDRVDWPHHNSHRLDLVALPTQQASDYLGVNETSGTLERGYRVDGLVLPIEERYFAHWNTDPWQLDYQGSGHTLACGTVYLLPYYLGRYHQLID